MEKKEIRHNTGGFEVGANKGRGTENESVEQDLDIGPHNWADKETTMLCMTCIYYVVKNDKLGRCRKNAPKLDGWPAVFPCEWCGNHKLDEKKI